MKSFFRSIAMLAMGVAVFTSCANDDFAVPNIECNEANLTPTLTVAEVSNAAETTPKKFDGSGIITGVIVSSDKGGNFHKELYLISDDSIAFKVPVNESNLHTYYNTGRRVFVQLGGLYIQKNNGILSIGDLFNNNVGQINAQTYRKHLIRACKTVDEKELLTSVSLKDAVSSDDYVGRLVKLEEVQFQTAEVGGTYYDANKVLGGQTNRLLEDKEGNTLIFRTSSFAEYSGVVVPNKSGTITGILTKFGNDFQFIARATTDIQLTANRFGNSDGGDGGDGGDGEEPTVTGQLAFMGADFEDWTVFLNQLTSHGLKEYATQQAGGGMEGTSAMGIIGTPAGNDYVFTVQNNANVPTGAEKISFFVKGTAAKSLSVNVYRSNGTNFDVYNLGDASASKVLIKDGEMNAQGNGTNQYVGSINTNGNWIKVSLDLTGVDYNTTGQGSFIAIKVGKDAAYDLLIDNIMIEGGQDNGDGGDNGGDGGDNGGGDGSTEGVSMFPGANFENWADFMGVLTTHGLKDYASQAVGAGRNGSNAMQLVGTPAGNDYVFTVQNITGVPADKTKISFWVKGEAGKSLSLNVYGNDGTTYKAFNVDALSADKEIAVAGNNQYGGAINTGGNWVKVTLDLTGVEYNTSGAGSLFALKVGKDQPYNILIDDIQFE